MSIVRMKADRASVSGNFRLCREHNFYRFIDRFGKSENSIIHCKRFLRLHNVVNLANNPKHNGMASKKNRPKGIFLHYHSGRSYPHKLFSELFHPIQLYVDGFDRTDLYINGQIKGNLSVPQHRDCSKDILRWMFFLPV